jgi:hypothetical protein
MATVRSAASATVIVVRARIVVTAKTVRAVRAKTAYKEILNNV